MTTEGSETGTTSEKNDPRSDQVVETQPNETIASRLTPNIPAGIATIAVRGPHAVDIVMQKCNLKVDTLVQDRIHYGLWPISVSDEMLYEQVVVCRSEESEVELHCHGGNAVCKAILSDLEALGCKLVDSSDWPYEEVDLFAREAEEDLIHARTDKVAALLLTQRNGRLRSVVSFLLDAIQNDTGDVYQQSVLEELDKLIADGEFGAKVIDGWSIVFAGPPNVGKSSLINRIVGQSRSIVHEEAGTTRDWVESEAVVDGWPVRLTDTAGIRETTDETEVEGVRRARERTLQADLVVLVADVREGWTETHEEISGELTLAGIPCIVCWSKVDLLKGEERSEVLASSSHSTNVLSSATDAPGIDALLHSLADALFARAPELDSHVPFRERHLCKLREATEALLKSDLSRASIALRNLLSD